MIYTRVFIEIYNQQKRKPIDNTYKMIKFEKYSITKREKPLNFGMY